MWSIFILILEGAVLFLAPRRIGLDLRGCATVRAYFRTLSGQIFVIGGFGAFTPAIRTLTELSEPVCIPKSNAGVKT